MGFFGCTDNVIVGIKLSVQGKSQVMGSADCLNGMALDAVRSLKVYVIESPTGKCLGRVED